jgi:arylsulfatase A-like enzyme
MSSVGARSTPRPHVLGRLSRFGAAVASLGVAVGAVMCDRPRPRPSVLLVTIDTLRADHVSAYGYTVRTTPRLDRLAREGVLFEQAYAGIPVTGPSHAMLMTGRAARALGLVRNGYRLRPGTETLAGMLKDKGWSTAAVVSAFPLSRRFGFATGFDAYDDKFLLGESSFRTARWEGRTLREPYDRRADATTRRAAAWLEQRRADEPFFLWVHYFDPHTPYDAPAAWRLPAAGDDGTRLRAAYDAEIRFVDDALGKLLDVLETRGRAQDTLVVVTSDHGEGLGDHGQLEHGPLVYEEAVRVPLVARFPQRLTAGVRCPGEVELMDVAPTVLELLGQPARQGLQGHSLVPRARGEPDDPRHVVIMQGEYDEGADETVFGVRQGRTKYIETRRAGAVRSRELYDLGSDAAERRDLAGVDPERAQRLAAVLQAWRRAIGPPRPDKIDPSDLEGLRALGYAQ